MVHSNTGTEFMCLSSLFQENDYSPDIMCWKHRHILNASHAIMFQTSMPTKFWGEATLTAASLINCTPTSLYNGRSPYEVLHGTKPDYGQLQGVWLCLLHSSYDTG